MKQILICALLITGAFSAFSQSKLDRSIAPKSGPAPIIQIGKYSVRELPNGLKVIVVENHKLPRISWSVNLDIDPVLEGKKTGYSGMAGELLGAGTATQSKAQIDARVDFLGATLSTSSEGLFATSLTKHTDALLNLMSDVLLHPSFPESELEKVKKQMISALTSEKTDPNSISEKIGNLLKYGQDHPYGEFPTEETVDRITRDDLTNYYNSYFRPNVAYLVVVGDITPERAFQLAEQYFGSWERAEVTPHDYLTPTAPKGNKVAFVPMPGAVQSVIDITYPVVLQPGTLEAIQASVLNTILGGSGFQTRLMQNLREDKAYTYGAYSSIEADEVVGSFSAGTSVRNEVTDSSIVELLYEMQRLINEPVADSTLQTVKNIMTGNFARSLERPQTVANFAQNIEKYGLPKDYYETYLQKLNAITVADVQRIAAKFLLPSNAYITVVGNKDTAPLLKRFSSAGEVTMYSPDGSLYKELKPAPAGVTTESVLLKYIQAIGGEKKLKKIKSFEQKGKMEMGPMALEMNSKTKTIQPGKMVLSVSMGGMDVMKQVYDGVKMASYQMGQKMPDDPAGLTDMQLSTDLMAEIHYAQYGIKAALKGMDQVNGQECYVVQLTLPGGSTTTEYYNVSSGLKSKSVKIQKKDDTTTTSEIVIEDYLTAKGGVKFPKTQAITAEGQTFKMVTSEVIVNAKMADDLFIVN